jgi:signal transduction histidine kinase/CheY-like chemotaxis protein
VIADQLGDAIVAIDRDGIVIYANPAAERLTGASIGASWAELVGDGPWLEATTRAEAIATLRGVRRVIADSITPLAEGGAAIVLRDITDHVVAKRRAVLAERYVGSASARAAIAHHVNNPLAVVLVHGELLRDALEEAAAKLPAGEAEKAREAMTSFPELERAANSIRQLMADLRAFSALPLPRGAEVEAHRVVAYAARANSRLRERARIFTHVELDEPIAMDEPSLAQILGQLIANAVDAIAPGAPEKHEIHVTVRADATRAIVEVRDDGCGLAEVPGDVTLRATPDGVHVGLGIAIVRELAGAVGGTLELARNEPTGTIARVSLPLANLQPVRSRVLVVDPDHVYARSLRRVLRDHDVIVYPTSAEALDHLERDTTFDLVMLDVSADLATRGLYRRLAADYPRLAARVVFTSAAIADPEIADFLATTPCRVLEKPVDAATLRALVTA